MKSQKSNNKMRTILVMAMAVMFSAAVSAQFEVPSPDSPKTQTLQEIRTGSTIEYVLAGTHTDSEEYRWVVTGGSIVSGGTVTNNGTSDIIEFTANAHTIEVQWGAAGGAIASSAGKIEVQKKSDNGCPSQIQTLDLNIWSLPTATITDTDIDFCSGEATPGTITVELTGAPDDGANSGFSVAYEYVASTNLTDENGDAVNGAQGVAETTNGSSVTIPLPANLISANSTADETFTVNLTTMTDDFTDQDGTWTAEGGSYVITVHPTLETGDIQSSFSMIRR